MADSKLRICSVCHQQYHYCPKCSENRDKELWYFSFCSSNCKNIYELTSKFENNQIDDAHINEKFQQLDLSKIESFGESYKNTIAKITEIIDKKNNIDTSMDISTEDNVDILAETNIDESIEYGIENADVEDFTETEFVKKTKGKKKQICLNSD